MKNNKEVAQVIMIPSTSTLYFQILLTVTMWGFIVRTIFLVVLITLKLGEAGILIRFIIIMCNSGRSRLNQRGQMSLFPYPCHHLTISHLIHLQTLVNIWLILSSMYFTKRMWNYNLKFSSFYKVDIHIF